jgi:hypothetical protein
MKPIFAMTLGALLATSCGDDSGVRRDAAVGDAKLADASLIDAAPQPVTLTITNAGSGVSGVTVFLHYE